VLNLQGKKIAVGPLEAAIQRHLNVEDVCLFAGLDDEGHEELVVAIQSDREPGKPQLDAVVRDFASFERVRFVVLKEFPRGDTGMSKVRRTALRRMVVPPTKSG
jgi:long-subunit acyl-CoA synthetase (AMP-forming)